MLDDAGQPGERNDVTTAGVEHKLGIHASPTCVMQMGDNGGAIGWMVGEENRGLAAMFTMMNRARLAVGIQGVAIAERALQQAVAYAGERTQGFAEGGPGDEKMVPIISHPDVRRMLLTMKAKTAAARAVCYLTARELDLAEHAGDEAQRKAALARANLFTPVAKAFATDLGVEVASDGVQVHGGMGYIEETGAAQHFRDARIAPIYEGTNGIQAIDLVTRKLPMEGGEVVRSHIAEMKDIVADVKGSNEPVLGQMGARLDEAVSALEEASEWMLVSLAKDPQAALAGATPYLRLFGLASGGTWLAKGALARSRAGNGASDAIVQSARFFAETQAVEAPGLARAISGGADLIADAGVEVFS
jgi:hypothetical protein